MDKKGRSFLNIIQDDLDSYKLFLPLKVFISFTKVHDLHLSIYLSIYLSGWYLHLIFLAKLINKNDGDLYRDDGLLILRNVNSQQTDQMDKKM